MTSYHSCICNIRYFFNLSISKVIVINTGFKNEISKFGASVKITNDSLHLIAKKNLKHDVEIDTYNDHRMAMAFAPLALKNNLKIKNEQVVTKSYPAFWKDLQSIGFQVIKI